MTKKDKNNKENLDDSDKDALSRVEVLQHIGNAINKEKIRREKVKKEKNLKTLRLDPDELIKSGKANFDTPMPQDLATLKSLIQSIVRDELKRN